MKFSMLIRALVLLTWFGFLFVSFDCLRAQPIEASTADDEAAGGRSKGQFEKVVLEGELTNPMELAVAPDGRVFFIERDGAVRVWTPATDSTTMVGYVPTFAIHNEGMMGLALDPDFAENGWLYVYHTPIGNATKNELVRFTVTDNRFDLESREVLLKVPTQRQMCCHSGGSIAFGPEGNLFVATGDNTNPEDVQLYAPFDERPGHAYWDAQRTAANTNDLRGKILRIRPQPDGTYATPDDNLFPEGERGRPEIYVMGSRNPYRISIDQETGCLYWGDVGPGASVAREERGPAGYDEINRACEAGNYGWPYFVADNKPYRDYDFKTEKSGAYFDAERPINDSPNNTGARVLPPAQPALIWYPHTESDTFPELGIGGQVAMAGPVYHYDAETAGPRGLPRSYDGSLFIYDFMRNWIKEVELGEAGNIQKIKPFLPGMKFARPMDLEVGPDGAMYLLEWGTNYGGYNEDAQIVRLDHYSSEQRASARRRASAASSSAGQAVPDLTFEEPVHGGFIDIGEPIRYRAAHGAEEGQLPEGRLLVQPYLGHDTHLHRLEPDTGRVGTVQVQPDSSHAPYIKDRFVMLEASYQGEGGAGGADALTSRARVVLQPRRMEAEHTASRHGAERSITGDIRRRTGVQTFLTARAGDYVSYAPVNMLNIDAITFRLAPEAGGRIELRLDGPDGPLLGKAMVEPAEEAGSEKGEAWQEVTLSITDPGGTHELFLVFRGKGDDPLLKLDWLHFNGPGALAEMKSP